MRSTLEVVHELRGGHRFVELGRGLVDGEAQSFWLCTYCGAVGRQPATERLPFRGRLLARWTRTIAPVGWLVSRWRRR